MPIQILRDVDLLTTIDERGRGQSPGAVISFTVTTVDGERYEAPSPQARQLEALFAQLIACYDLERFVPPYRTCEADQLALF